MKPRSFFITLAVVSVILISVAVGSFYWIIQKSPLNLIEGGITDNPKAAMFVPNQAPVMLSLLVNPDRLENFRQVVALPKERRRSKFELSQLKKNLLANTNLDYERDIKPWLGDEVTLAVTSLDYDRDESNGVQPGYLLIAATEDEELAKEELQLAYTQDAIAGTYDLAFEEYKGVNLIYKNSLSPQPNSKILASAVVGDYVLFANHPKVLRDAINNVQVENLNLNNSPAYQDALKTIEDPKIGVVYVNLPAISAWIANAPIPEIPEVKQMLTVSLSLKPQGLVAETALYGVTDEEIEKQPALSQPVQALQYIPADSILTAAGTDLNNFWNQVNTGLDTDSPLQQIITQGIDFIQSPFQIDLPEDIFSWVKGEYALALLPETKNTELDWVFVAEKPSISEENNPIEKLDSLAIDRDLNVVNIPILDQEITSWTKLSTKEDNADNKTNNKKGKDKPMTRLDTEVKGAHVSMGNYEIFATSVEALEEALQAGENSLLTSEKFQLSIEALSQNNDGYFYVDWQEIDPLLASKIPLIKVLELPVKPLFDNLQSLTLSSEGAENGVRRSSVFLRLGLEE